MVVKQSKIVSCTNSELFKFYLDSGWDEVMDYNEYKRRCKDNGTTIIDDEE